MDNDELTRRDFVTTVAAGIVAAAGTDLGAQQVTETNVDIKTPDGTCDAAFIHPASGAHPAVIVWPDAFGLRPSMREMAKRLAASGYSVLAETVYRVAKLIWEDASRSTSDRAAEDRAADGIEIGADRCRKRASLHRGSESCKPQVDRNKKIGTQGCMGVRSLSGPQPRCQPRRGAPVPRWRPVTPTRTAPSAGAEIKGRGTGIATNDDAAARCRSN
jgi:carboxymethylenebutenolidase